MSAWQQHAACRSAGPDVFVGTSTHGPDEARARLLCAVCPVQAPCRDFARATNQLGVWGGESDAERRLALGDRSRRVRKPGSG